MRALLPMPSTSRPSASSETHSTNCHLPVQQLWTLPLSPLACIILVMVENVFYFKGEIFREKITAFLEKVELGARSSHTPPEMLRSSEEDWR